MPDYIVNLLGIAGFFLAVLVGGAVTLKVADRGSDTRSADRALMIGIVVTICGAALALAIRTGYLPLILLVLGTGIGIVIVAQSVRRNPGKRE